MASSAGARAAAASASAADDEADVHPERADNPPSGAGNAALIEALNTNNTNQRALNETIKAAFDHIAAQPTLAPFDSDALAAALAPSLASAVDRASGPKKIDSGRPSSEPFRSFPRPDLKPLPAAAEVKDTEVFNLAEFDLQIRRDNLQCRFYALELRTNEHARRVIDHIANHLERTSLDLLPGYETYVPYPGEINMINDKLNWSLLS